MFPCGLGAKFGPVRSLILFFSVFISVLSMGHAALAEPLELDGSVQACLTAPSGAAEAGCLPICAPYILSGLRQGLEIVKEIEGPEGDAYRAWLTNAGCLDAATQQVVRGSDLVQPDATTPNSNAVGIRPAAGPPTGGIASTAPSSVNPE